MLQIYPIPAFKDNYFWLIQPDAPNPAAYIVDPGAAEPVIQALEYYQLQLKSILITHHHHDHIDGAVTLSECYKTVIYGPDSAKIPQVTHRLGQGDEIQLGSIAAKVLLLPGHTRDHIGYYLASAPLQPRLFCGDTLFAAGCGRLFDGTADQLFHSLQTLAQLPDNTLIYSAHEYVLANLEFACHIEPQNPDIVARQHKEAQKRRQNLPSIPSPLLLEKRTNPFLRCHLPVVHQRVEQLSGYSLTSESEVFTQLRRLKDQF